MGNKMWRARIREIVSPLFSWEWVVQYIPFLVFSITLVLIHYFAVPFKESLTFVPSNPVWYTFITNAFVHHDASHLWNNVWMFIFATLALLYLGRRLNRLKGFYIISVVLVFGTPIFLAFYELANPSAYTAASLGSSGIVTAFVAFLPAFVLLLIGIKKYWYYLSYIILASVLSILRMKFWRQGLLTFGIIFVAHCTFWYIIYKKGTWKLKFTPQDLGETIVIVCYILVMPAVIYSLFTPEVDFVAQTKTNLLAHSGALLFGMTVGSAYFSLTYEGVDTKELKRSIKSIVCKCLMEEDPHEGVQIEIIQTARDMLKVGGNYYHTRTLIALSSTKAKTVPEYVYLNPNQAKSLTEVSHGFAFAVEDSSFLISNEPKEDKVYKEQLVQVEIIDEFDRKLVILNSFFDIWKGRADNLEKEVDSELAELKFSFSLIFTALTGSLVGALEQSRILSYVFIPLSTLLMLRFLFRHSHYKRLKGVYFTAKELSVDRPHGERLIALRYSLALLTWKQTNPAALTNPTYHFVLTDKAAFDDYMEWWKG